MHTPDIVEPGEAHGSEAEADLVVARHTIRALLDSLDELGHAPVSTLLDLAAEACAVESKELHDEARAELDPARRRELEAYAERASTLALALGGAQAECIDIEEEDDDEPTEVPS